VASGYTQASTSFWILAEGARNSEEAELLSPPESAACPLEFVVPACSESCFSPPLLDLHLPWRNADDYVRVGQVGGGRACGLHVGSAGGEGGNRIPAGFAR